MERRRDLFAYSAELLSRLVRVPCLRRDKLLRSERFSPSRSVPPLPTELKERQQDTRGAAKAAPNASRPDCGCSHRDPLLDGKAATLRAVEIVARYS